MSKYKITINKEDEELLKSIAKRLKWQIEHLTPERSQQVINSINEHRTILTPVNTEFYYPSTFKLQVYKTANIDLLKNNEMLNALSRFPLSSKSYHLAVRVIENDTTRMYFEVDERLKIVSILLITPLL